MARRRLFWKLFLPNLAIVAAALIVTGFFVSATARHFLREQIAADLRVQARMLAHRLADQLDRPDEVQAICAELGREAAQPGIRFTVVHISGQVLGDSAENPDVMDNHANRTEIREALRPDSDGVGRSTRRSATLREEMMYVAVPITGPDGPVGTARVAIALTSVRETTAAIHRRIAIGIGFVGLAGALAALWISRTLARPLATMERGAERFAAGDLSGRLPVPDTVELAGLAEALNSMAAELDRRINTVVQQRAEQEAILASMSEGVLAVDGEEQVISMNRTAAQMLTINREQAVGRTIQEVVRNPELQQFIQKALEEPDGISTDLEIRAEGQPRLLEMYSAQLTAPNGLRKGVVVVMNNVTRVRQLENLRRDFVANVSHELKTPITSIKGFVETLLDGALDNPDEARRFLHIVENHADRLTAIIEDLLLLSRIEQDQEKSGIGLDVWPVADILRSAAESCQVRADENNVALTLECLEELSARVNAQLLELAVVNLIDNAIKYSDQGDSVGVSARQIDGRIALTVSDTGCGIASKHLPRLFERFYRADKARSRSLGGTGLGLAIVKHIVRAHRGEVTVESEPGKGSTFTIWLPDPASGAPGMPEEDSVTDSSL